MSQKKIIVILSILVAALAGIVLYQSFSETRQIEAAFKNDEENKKKAIEATRKFYGTEFSKGTGRPM